MSSFSERIDQYYGRTTESSSNSSASQGNSFADRLEQYNNQKNPYKPSSTIGAWTPAVADKTNYSLDNYNAWLEGAGTWIDNANTWLTNQKNRFDTLRTYTQDEVDDYNCRCGLVPVEWAE